MSDISAAGFMRRRSVAEGTASGGANVDQLVRTQRRMGLLQTYADTFVTSNPAAAIALAEGGVSDDEILNGAMEAEGFAAVRRIQKDLDAESTEVQRTVYANLPTQMQTALDQLGYRPPGAQSESGAGRLFGSIPVLGTIAKPALDWGELPLVGGAAEEMQHIIGEGLEPVGAGLTTVLNTAAWPQEQLGHFTRAAAYSTEEGEAFGSPLQGLAGPAFALATGDWTPSEIARAWNNTDEEDGYVRPNNENRARRLLEGDNEAYDLAHAEAMRTPPEDIIEKFGYDPGSPEATQLIAKLQQLQRTEGYTEAVNAIASGFVSAGRVFAQDLFGLEDTEHGLGRFTSGLFDAGFVTFTDPLLLAGAATKFTRFGRNAFRLESAAGRATATRQADLALGAYRARVGEDVGEISSDLARISRPDARLGKHILSWSDRVAEGFRTKDWASMIRDLPSAGTAMQHMSDYHVRQLAEGGRGLDDTLGVIEYLQNRDGLLAIAGTRIGGASPKVWGLRMPTLTPMDRAAAAGKKWFTDTIDWARFVGQTPDRVYGPVLSDVARAAGNPTTFVRQAGRWVSSKTVGNAGRTMSMLTAHTPYRDVLSLSGPDAVPEFSRLINTGLFSGMSRQTMDDFMNAFTAGDVATRAKVQQAFLQEIFQRGGIHDTPFAQRFLGRAQEAYAFNPDDGSLRLVDIGNADIVSIPDVRGLLTTGAARVNHTRAVFHGTPSAWADAQLGRFWKPSVLIRLGFIARAAGEELLHTMLKNGPRMYLGTLGSNWRAQSDKADEIRAALGAAENAGHADEVNRLRHQLADVEGSIMIAPVRALMAGSDRMFAQMFKSSRDDAAKFRRRLHEKAERFDPEGDHRTVTGLERFADEMSLWASGIIGKIGAAAPGDMSKVGLGDLMAKHWNPDAARATRDLMHHPWVQRSFAESISGSTMTPYEYRGLLDADGMPVEKIMWGEMRGGVPVTEEVKLRPMPGETNLSRVLDDPTFYNSLYARHRYTREDRVERAIVDNVLPRYVGPWGEDTASALGYDNLEDLRTDLNKAWSHEWSPTERARLEQLGEEEARRTAFEGGEDAVGFLRRYLDGDVDEELPKGWIGGRLKDVFSDAGTSMSAGRLISFLDDPRTPMAAKRWLLYSSVDPGRLIRDGADLQNKMRHAARGRLARPDMYGALRQNRLYTKGEELARPVQHGLSKVYVPLMPAQYQATELGDDFIEAAKARIFKIGGYGPEQADTIARNVAAASVNPGLAEAAARIGQTPLAAWGSADPRIAEAVMASIEDVTGIRARFGILEVPDEVVEYSTNSILAQGLRAKADATSGITDYAVDSWRLMHTRPTDEIRRYKTLNVGDEPWDDGLLDAAQKQYEATPAAGMTRVYSGDRMSWTPEPPEGPFHFADVPSGEVAAEGPREMLASFRIDDLRAQAKLLKVPRYSRMKKDELVDALAARPEMQATLTAQGATQLSDEVLDAAGVHRLPGAPGSWSVDSVEVSPGLGEIDALERAAGRTVDEITEILTTIKKGDIDDDVLHEIVEPLLRPNRRIIDDDGNEHLRRGYTHQHLIRDTKADRLPTESYGPRMFAGRNANWNGFVREWFDGPVNRAISSVVRKNMFLQTYGEQLRNMDGIADLFVEPAAKAAATSWAGESADNLDDIVRAIVDLDTPRVQFVDDAEIRAILDEHEMAVDVDDLAPLKTYATQRHHALNLARENSLNRTMQLVIPYIDDHRIRSAFQGYVGNYIPFLFAEEQFLKRWVRSAVESPEMIRKAQLAMNGFRSMGTVRRDDQGREIFVYPLIGDAASLIAKPLEWMTGSPLSLPYEVEMTGDVGYTLPGFGDQMGVPSVGPLVGLGVEVLSRHYPELAEFEDVLVSRGANRPLWQYVMPAGLSKLWEAGWGDIDQGQLASATVQAIQTMAINGQLPPETATPEERQEFIDRARSQARFILGARGMFGLTAPAAPAVQFEHDELTDEFRSLLQADIPFEEAIRLFLANHAEAEPADILAATVSTSEAEFSGLDMPTDEAFTWVTDHNDLVEAYPAASAWLVPRADAKDTFSQRAYNQQLAKGLRTRKAPKDFVDDIYFRTASQDYFDARQLTEERTMDLTGGARQQAMEEWRVWKDSYFAQHPLFAVMLQDPERQQKRRQAIDQLIALSGRDDDLVPAEMVEMMDVFKEFQLTINALRGDRRRTIANHRSSVVGETAAWMQWHIQRHPHLAGPYLRLLEPELREADEEAVMEVIE